MSEEFDPDEWTECPGVVVAAVVYYLLRDW